MLSHRSFPSKIYVCVPLLVGICVSLSYGAGAHTNSNATHPSEHTQIQVSHTQIHCMPRICVCATVLMWNSCDTFLWDTSLSILQLPTIFHSFLKCFCTRCESLKGWRTMLVIPELEHEVKLLSESKSTRKVWIAQLLVKRNWFLTWDHISTGQKLWHSEAAYQYIWILPTQLETNICMILLRISS